MVSVSHPESTSAPGGSFLQKLNGVWHERALQLYMVVVLLHWAEHLMQAFQIYVMGWPRPESRGFLGQFFPWLVQSETLHYFYAIFMLVGLFLLLPGFTGRARTWWIIALVIQFWHHIEHFVLQAQIVVGQNMFGSTVPVSFVQVLMPKMRVELHLFYNTVVFIPMVIAMYYHMYPPASEREHTVACSCRRVGRKAA
jgi:hypothetical protein